MKTTIKDKEKLQSYLLKIEDYIGNKKLFCTKYIDLKVKIIRVLCYTPEIAPLMEKQITYTLVDKADKYDETLVVFKETDVDSLAKPFIENFDDKDKKLYEQELKYNKETLDYQGIFSIQLVDENFSQSNPIMIFDFYSKLVDIYDEKKHIYYYGVKDFSPEEFIKNGHIFIKQLNCLIKTQNVNLVHGAVIGTNNNGILLCARGQRGKSTLAINSMLYGLDYVSDDYQILEQKDDNIYAYPIYSIITLSPKMYNELYYKLDGKFVSNNARKDKYVINISKYHDKFRSAYPINVCIFPEIVDSDEPKIYDCLPVDKARAIVQLIHSTVMQVGDLNNKVVIKKLFNMINNKPFYKFDLCKDIDKNTQYLEKFLQNNNCFKQNNIECKDMLVDITFDLANILDCKTFNFYLMNRVATNVYELLLNNVPIETIIKQLEQFIKFNENILKELDSLVDIINTKKFLMEDIVSKKCDINFDLVKEDKFHISVLECNETKIRELIKIKEK